MNPELKSYLKSILGSSISRCTAVRGGDIAQAYLIETSSHQFFVKTSAKPWAEQLFICESRGLKQLASTRTVKVPKVYVEGVFDKTGYLVLEFVESKRPDSEDFERLGQKLAELHLAPLTTGFGAEQDNFIGDLPQSNRKHENWTDFYVFERLKPQLKLAIDNNLLGKEQIPKEEKLQKTMESLTGGVNTSLLHGDLWGGNFLIAKDGTPVLIDPSVYSGHSEVDMAMSRLFGGFGGSFYSTYHDIVPKHPNQKELTEIYQLYYLLVHLNLFGSSYRNSVISILNEFFL